MHRCAARARPRLAPGAPATPRARRHGRPSCRPSAQPAPPRRSPHVAWGCGANYRPPGRAIAGPAPINRGTCPPTVAPRRRPAPTVLTTGSGPVAGCCMGGRRRAGRLARGASWPPRAGHRRRAQPPRQPAPPTRRHRPPPGPHPPHVAWGCGHAIVARRARHPGRPLRRHGRRRAPASRPPPAPPGRPVLTLHGVVARIVARPGRATAGTAPIGHGNAAPTVAPCRGPAPTVLTTGSWSGGRLLHGSLPRRRPGLLREFSPAPVAPWPDPRRSAEAAPSAPATPPP